MVWNQKKELLHMIGSSHYFPKTSKSKPEGEDAHLFCESRQAIVVCDGVGGWAEEGIDSGIYARNFVRNAEAAFKKQQKHCVNPKAALIEAHANTTAEGSSTACVIALKGNRLRFANVGDSGFLVFRGGERLVYQSPKGQYEFNFPYQLEKEESVDSSEVNEGEVEVEAGDIVLAGTDGLFDNLFVHEIENILQDTTGGSSTQNLAWKIASRALSNSKDENYESPFQKEALREEKVHRGGKPDDITVVVVAVVAKIAEQKKLELRWWKRLALKWKLF